MLVSYEYYEDSINPSIGIQFNLSDYGHGEEDWEVIPMELKIQIIDQVIKDFERLIPNWRFYEIGFQYLGEYVEIPKSQLSRFDEWFKIRR